MSSITAELHLPGQEPLRFNSQSAMNPSRNLELSLNPKLLEISVGLTLPRILVTEHACSCKLIKIQYDPTFDVPALEKCQIIHRVQGRSFCSGDHCRNSSNPRFGRRFPNEPALEHDLEGLALFYDQRIQSCVRMEVELTSQLREIETHHSPNSNRCQNAEELTGNIGFVRRWRTYYERAKLLSEFIIALYRHHKTPSNRCFLGVGQALADVPVNAGLPHRGPFRIHQHGIAPCFGPGFVTQLPQLDPQPSATESSRSAGFLPGMTLATNNSVVNMFSDFSNPSPALANGSSVPRNTLFGTQGFVENNTNGLGLEGNQTPLLETACYRPEDLQEFAQPDHEIQGQPFPSFGNENRVMVPTGGPQEHYPTADFSHRIDPQLLQLPSGDGSKADNNNASNPSDSSHPTRNPDEWDDEWFRQFLTDAIYREDAMQGHPAPQTIYVVAQGSGIINLGNEMEESRQGATVTSESNESATATGQSTQSATTTSASTPSTAATSASTQSATASLPNGWIAQASVTKRHHDQAPLEGGQHVREQKRLLVSLNGQQCLELTESD